MRAGDSDSATESHQFSQHLRPRYNRNPQLPGCLYFRIVPGYRAGHNQHIGALDLTGIVAPEYRHSQPAQVSRGPVFSEIRTTDLKFLVDEDLRDSTHASTRNTDKVHSSNSSHGL